MMRLHKKQLLAMGMAVGLSVLSVFPALAGEWVQLKEVKEGKEFTYLRYVEADGSFPVSTWQMIDGKQYYFDANGYMATGWQTVEGNILYFDASGAKVNGWRFIDQNWHYFDENGVMLSNLVCNGGHLDENGLWVSDKIPPKSSKVATPEDTTYWTSKLMEYNLTDKEFQANADGSFGISVAYDQYATRPDLLNTVFAKAAYAFPQGFSYEWSMVDGIFNFRVTKVGAAQ